MSSKFLQRQTFVPRRSLQAFVLVLACSALFADAAAAATGDLIQKTGLAGCISETGLSDPLDPTTAGQCADGRALGFSYAVTVSPDGKNSYVSGGGSDGVAVLDRAADGTLTQKPGLAGCISDTGAGDTGAGPCVDGKALDFPTGVAVSPDGRSAYVSSYLGDAVAVFDRAADGTLTQKPLTAGCISDTGRSTPTDPATAGQCFDGRALDGPAGVTVSPDGTNVYVSSYTGDAVAVFDRAADGSLTQKPLTAGCISDTGRGNFDVPATAGQCVDGTALDGATSVIVTPDGKSVYVASFDPGGLAVLAFDRAGDGTLTQKPGTAGCISETGAGPCVDGRSLEGISFVTVSPDGNNIYTASLDGGVGVFDRAADGSLTQKSGTAGCISEDGAGDAGSGPCVDGTGVDGATGVWVSPDGKSAYAASFFSDAVTVFDRAADGTLTQKPGPAGCISDTGRGNPNVPATAGQCFDGTALAGATQVTVSADGKNAYVVSNRLGAVAVFDRAADTTPPGTTTPDTTTPGTTTPGTTTPGTTTPIPPSTAVRPAPGFAGCSTLSANVIIGTAAGNTITGTTGADRIFAGTGNDTVDALPGNDCVDLGGGIDRGQGGLGDDLLLGGLGDDTISGSSGNDRLRGDEGNDRLSGNGGNDRILGGTGADVLFGGFGNDALHGQSGNDKIFGGPQRDRISAGSGNDRISTAGDRARDRVNCGTGRDTVIADRVDRVARNCERIRRR